jgi:hypothetical protein
MRVVRRHPKARGLGDAGETRRQIEHGYTVGREKLTDHRVLARERIRDQIVKLGQEHNLKDDPALATHVSKTEQRFAARAPSCGIVSIEGRVIRLIARTGIEAGHQRLDSRPVERRDAETPEPLPTRGDR